MQPNQPEQSVPEAVQPVPAPASTPETPTTVVTPTAEQATPMVSMADAPTAPVVAPVTSTSEQPVHWQATEYIHHEKNMGWFIVFGIVVLGFMAIAIFLINSITFAILIPVMAAALLVYTHRPPRILDYTLSSKGLYVNEKLYPLPEYKSFGIIQDAGEFSVMLIPVKRFKPGVTVYFPENAGEAIVDMLGARLPMQDLRLDAIDRLIRKLRI